MSGSWECSDQQGFSRARPRPSPFQGVTIMHNIVYLVGLVVVVLLILGFLGLR